MRRKYDERWGRGGSLDFLTVHNDVMSKHDANARVSDYVRSKIRAIVKDPVTAELLCPKIPIGVKRFLVDTNYFETYNRSNVSLIDISEHGIDRISSRGIVVGDQEFAVEVIVFATGFDAMTGPLLRIDLEGRNGLSLRDYWSNGPQALLGMQVAGFPNLFLVSGPFSPSVLAVMTIGIEQQVDWIADCLVHMREPASAPSRRHQRPNPSGWSTPRDLVRDTLRVKYDSWYLGANIPGKPRVFMVYTGGLGPTNSAATRPAPMGTEASSSQRWPKAHLRRQLRCLPQSIGSPLGRHRKRRESVPSSRSSVSSEVRLSPPAPRPCRRLPC